ncbi:MAG: LPS export ABC transporter periplasmic protein LptC [Candidatus Omnitrophica bacterium]|nr:LPS export ABC transporter periplasmic protein LptC [Candidatus Omnitrophota bacterium]
MLLKRVTAILLMCLAAPGISEGLSQQRIEQFYLSNLKEDGTRDWEITGNEAMVYEKHVDIDRMNAKFFGDGDTVSVKSNKAKLIKESANVFLREDVEIENQQGMKMNTESLDWIRSDNKIETDEWVQVQRDDMQVRGKGLRADTALKNIDFNKDIELQIPQGQKYISIRCEGPLEIQYHQGTALFRKNVVVTDRKSKLFSDRAKVHFDPESKEIRRIVAEGHVKIIRDENVTFAEKATYMGKEGRVILEGTPRLIYFPNSEETE